MWQMEGGEAMLQNFSFKETDEILEELKSLVNSCIELIKKRRGLDRSFKAKVPDELYDMIKEKILM